MTVDHRSYKNANRDNMLGKFKLDEDYNIPDQIQQRVNEESWWEWARKNERSPLPKHNVPEIQKNKVGWYIFFKIMLNELRP